MENKENLWKKYQKNPSPEIREEIILEYASLVKIVAGKLSMYLGNYVEFDDLVSYGIFGLIDAIDKFDVSKEVKFETYASLRIRGAILDQIRKMDWIPRNVRAKQKMVNEAISKIENQYGKQADDEAIAKELGMNDDEYTHLQSQIKVTNIVSLNEFLEQGNQVGVEGSMQKRYSEPEEVVDQQELKEVLTEALDILTEKEKKVILLYYYEDLTLKEISKVLNVTESRVSQLHTKALGKMKPRIGKYINMF